MKAAAPKAEQPPPRQHHCRRARRSRPSAEKYLTAPPSPAVGSVGAASIEEPLTEGAAADTLEESSAAKLQAVQRGRSGGARRRRRRRRSPVCSSAAARRTARARSSTRRGRRAGARGRGARHAGSIVVLRLSLGGQSLDEIPVDGAAPEAAARRASSPAASPSWAPPSRRRSHPAAPAAAPPPATVDKAGYSAWEAEVIAAFFSRSHERTPLMPTDGAPVHLRKEKYILVADASTSSGNPLSAEVAAGASGAARSDVHPAPPSWEGRGRRRALRLRGGCGRLQAPGDRRRRADQLAPEARRAACLRGGVDEMGGPNASADIDDVARVLLFQWNALAKESLSRRRRAPRAILRNPAQFCALL